MMKPRGFTLVEVLVALSVVAIGLLALVSTAAHYTRQSVELRDRAFAGWVAANRLAELRIEPAFPEPGTDSGESTMGGIRWTWRVVVTPAPDEADLRRVDVAVAHAGAPDETVVLLTGFIGRYRPFTMEPQP